MSDRFLEQIINIKFHVKLGRDESNTCVVVFEAFGGEGMKKSNVFELYEPLKGSHENVEDERRGRPRSHRTDENVDKVRNLVHSTAS
jgi:hypothetical protein